MQLGCSSMQLLPHKHTSIGLTSCYSFQLLANKLQTNKLQKQQQQQQQQQEEEEEEE
jgi:hypothetical protein